MEGDLTSLGCPHPIKAGFPIKACPTHQNDLALIGTYVPLDHQKDLLHQLTFGYKIIVQHLIPWSKKLPGLLIYVLSPHKFSASLALYF